MLDVERKILLDFEDAIPFNMVDNELNVDA
jgi:hypothetical protein